MAMKRVSGQLADLLELDAVEYQPGMAGLGNPPRLQPNGQITHGTLTWDVDPFGLPPHQQSELLVQSGGVLQGRFLLTPSPGRRP
jgi:hypothetical protein